jgi:3-deoxy-D-manno-octulosonic-acid transferase
LRKFYSLADVVFVGRSLANMGGSDMMEVAALAKPIVVGPHNENFADVVKKLWAAQAIMPILVDLTIGTVWESLTQAVSGLLSNPEDAAQLAGRARKVVESNRGATERTLQPLLEILERAEHRPATATDG